MGHDALWQHEAGLALVVTSEEASVIEFTFAVTVKAETAAHAAKVMIERIGHDEDYGFPYEIDYPLYPFEIDGEPVE